MSDTTELGRDVQVVMDAIFTHVDLQSFAADHVLDRFTCEDGTLDAERLLTALRLPMVALINTFATAANVSPRALIEDVKRRADRMALEGE